MDRQCANALTLARFLEAAPVGGRALLIEGEAGIGKTALFQDGVQAAQARGTRVLAARSAQAETQIAFATMGDLFTPPLEEMITLVKPTLSAATSCQLMPDLDSTLISSQLISTDDISPKLSKLTPLVDKAPTPYQLTLA